MFDFWPILFEFLKQIEAINSDFEISELLMKLFDAVINSCSQFQPHEIHHGHKYKIWPNHISIHAKSLNYPINSNGCHTKNNTKTRLKQLKNYDPIPIINNLHFDFPYNKFQSQPINFPLTFLITHTYQIQFCFTLRASPTQLSRSFTHCPPRQSVCRFPICTKKIKFKRYTYQSELPFLTVMTSNWYE